MKALYIVRHAKSNNDDPRLADIDRPLNSRGLRDAPEMGRRLLKRGVIVDTIISSPALRAQTTAKLIAESMNEDVSKVSADDRIYASDISGMMVLIRSLSDSLDRVMFVGHDPTFSDLVDELSGGSIDSVPTCAIYGVELPIDSWSKTRFEDAKELFYDYPKKSFE